MAAATRAAPARYRRLAGLGTLAAGAYLAAVVAVEISRAAGGGPSVHALASDPAGLAAGRVWQLLTSAFIVAGVPILQILLLVPVVALTIALLGPGTFWAAALTGHVVATLIAYAGVGVVWLFDPSVVADVTHDPDYGVSCIWAGALGALLGSPIAPRAARRLGAAAGIAIVAFVPFATDLAGLEHVLAFALGALVASRGRGTLSQPKGA